MTLEYIGPFGNPYPYRMTIDGYQIPYIKGHKKEDGNWILCLDGRYEIDTTEDEINRWLRWVANAMAIAAGYNSFGEHANLSNPFKRKLIGLSTFDIEDISESQ